MMGNALVVDVVERIGAELARDLRWAHGAVGIPMEASDLVAS